MSAQVRSSERVMRPGGNRPLLRTDIDRLLEDRPQARLTLVLAPPGYGKTLLLEQWRSRFAAAGRGHLDYTLVRDDDPEALTRGLMRSAAASRRGARVRRRGNEEDLSDLLRTLPAATTIFIDGFGQRTHADVGRLLTRLVEEREHDVHFVLAASVEPDMPLATMEAYGSLARIGPSELALDTTRTQLFLQDVLNSEVSPATAREFHEYTEGWPIGLKLLASEASVQTGGGLLVSARAERRIDNFFRENAFARLTEEQIGLLLELAPLQSWDKVLCEPLLGERYQADLLETLFRLQCFVTEASDGSLRPHRMFSDFLLRRRGRAAAIAAHRHAAAVLAGAGSLAEAVDQALAGDDIGSAVDWAESCILDVFHRGEHRRVRAWLEGLPAAEVQKRPRLCLAAGLIFYGSREPERALHFLAAGARAVRSRRAEGDTELLHQISLLQTFYPIVCDDSQAGRRALTSSESALTEEDVSAGQLVRAWCALYEMGVSTAESILQDAVEEPHLHSVTVDLHRLHLKALVARVSGQLHRSHGLCMEMHRIGLSLQQPDSPMLALAVAGAGLLAYEWGQPAEVESSLPAHLTGLYNSGSVEGLMAGYTALIRSQSALGKLGDARATLAQIEDFAAGRDIERLIVFCKAERAMLYLADGDLARAVNCAAELVSTIEAGRRLRGSANMARLMALRTAAAINVAAGDPEAAIPLLLTLSDELGRLGFLHDLASVHALLSVALHHVGQRIEARQYAAGALAIGEPAGMLRSFADCGPTMATVLRDLRGAIGQRAFRKISPKYLNTLLDYLTSGAASPEPISVGSIMRSAPLSSREAEIARLIFNGLSNKEVGRALQLSNETVKWHLSNIYQKLNVSGRAEAVQSILKRIRDRDTGLAAMEPHGYA